MQTSPIADWFRGRGLELREYRGSLTAWHGGGKGALGAARPASQTVVCDASWRAALTIRGPEARKWLNGMVSANVRDLEPGAWAASFQLDPKGHILATLDVVCTGADAFVVLTEQAQVASLLERLRRFVFISKLTLADQSAAWSALRLRGAGAESLWAAAESVAEVGIGAVLRSSPRGMAQIEVVAEADAIAVLWQRLSAAATVIGAEEEECHRILSREPRMGLDIHGSELPQETGASERLSFIKGCYVGQEIVERIRARGAVHRHLCGLELTGEAAVGSSLTVEAAEGAAATEAGRLTSVAACRGKWIGLGYLRDPHATPGTRVRAGAVEAVVAE